MLATYCDKRFSATERLSAITNNLLMLEEKWVLNFVKIATRKIPLLAQLTNQLGIYFNINQIDPLKVIFPLT